MIFVIDANIIISALIRESKTREILYLSTFTLYSPDILLESIKKYKEEFVEKSGLTTEEFDTLLNFFLDKVTIVKMQNIIPN